MWTDIKTSVRPAITLMLAAVLLTGFIYPMLITGIGQLLFPYQANGSLVVDHGQVIGSELIGQSFTFDRYFHGRPSAAGNGYDAANSSGSNLGPTSKALVDRVATDVKKLRTQGITSAIPADMVTTSASGLDPHVSPETAELQIHRVASARNLPDAEVARVVTASTQGRWLGIIGEPRINVLLLNRQLDALAVSTAE